MPTVAPQPQGQRVRFCHDAADPHSGVANEAFHLVQADSRAMSVQRVASSILAKRRGPVSGTAGQGSATALRRSLVASRRAKLPHLSVEMALITLHLIGEPV